MDESSFKANAKPRPGATEVNKPKDKDIVVTGKFIRTAVLKEEWYEDVSDPTALLDDIKAQDVKADILSFWQRFPDIDRKFPYHMEYESLAVLDIKSFADWYKSLSEDTRRNVKKAEKKGVIIREPDFDDDFINGMMVIFNESPIRQGKPFRHYGKDFDTVKAEFSRYLYRENVVGAYYENQLIGFLMLSNAGYYALPSMIIAKAEHKDKAPTNALIGAAVKICERKNIHYLIYNNWAAGSIGEFKRRNGFEKKDVPRYYIPLTLKGRLALQFGLHHKVTDLLPEKLVEWLIDVRKRFADIKYGMHDRFSKKERPGS